MKAVTLVLSCLLVAACWALPRTSEKAALLERERSLVVTAILEAIEDVRKEIDEPMKMDEFNYNLQELGLVRIFEGIIRILNLILHGLSTFRIENMNYAVLSSTVTFDLYVDVLEASMDHFELKDGIVDGDAVSGKGHGNVKVFGAHIGGSIRVSVGIISGISIRSVNLGLDIDDIKVDAVADEIHGIGDRDVNEYIETSTMHIIKNYPREISATLNRIVWEILESIL